jgi:hypothetical protein
MVNILTAAAAISLSAAAMNCGSAPAAIAVHTNQLQDPNWQQTFRNSIW